MGKKKARPAVWLVFLQGTLLALGIYLAGILLLALLLVRGSASESAAFPITAILCIFGAASGGILTSRRSSWGALPSSMLNAVIFVGILALVGLLCWQGITWNGRGGILIVSALAGGVLGGFLGSRRSHRRKKRSL